MLEIFAQPFQRLQLRHRLGFGDFRALRTMADFGFFNFGASIFWACRPISIMLRWSIGEHAAQSIFQCKSIPKSAAVSSSSIKASAAGFRVGGGGQVAKAASS